MATRKWGNELLVNTGLTGYQTDSAVAGLVGGGFVVVWQDYNFTSTEIRAQRYDAAGVRLGSPIAVSTLALQDGSQTKPSVTALADGGFFVGWNDEDSSTDHDVAGAVFNASGGFVRIQFGDGSSSDSLEGQVARLGTGSVAVWTNNNPAVDDDIYYRTFDVVGISSTIFTANAAQAGDQFSPSVATRPDGTGIAIVWKNNSDGGSLRSGVFSPTGSVISTETILNTGAGTQVFDPKVAWLNNENFAVVWREYISGNLGDNQIKVKIFDGSASPANELTSIISVNSTIADSQQNPTLTALPNGGFVVTWTDTSGVGGDTNFAIKLQAFDGSGGKIGGEILVNTTTTGTQQRPSVSALSDGRVVVTWTDDSSGFDDIRSQIVDPRDGIVDGTTGIDKLYGHDSVGDIISANDGADTVFGLAGSDTIYGGKGIDNLYGGRGDDTVFGEDDNDILYGDLGDDAQYGGNGNDIIYSAGGGDLMDGGAGTGDAAFYVNELLGVTVNLTDQLLTAGAALGDTLFNFERVYGSVRGANNLTGDNNANILVGGQINDIMRGNGGADVLRGWFGVDTMAGGTGNDIFQYTGNTEGGDVITDFAAGDKFQFVRTAFGNLAGATVVAANFLSVASGHAATTASQRFIFDQSTKQLWYDANGNGAGTGVMIADLSTTYNILNTDLLLA